eukprot:UN24935
MAFCQLYLQNAMYGSNGMPDFDCSDKTCDSDKMGIYFTCDSPFYFLPTYDTVGDACAVSCGKCPDICQPHVGESCDDGIDTNFYDQCRADGSCSGETCSDTCADGGCNQENGETVCCEGGDCDQDDSDVCICDGGNCSQV